jgi:hypothetical protein
LSLRVAKRYLTDASFDAAVLLGNGGAGGGHSQIAW